MTLPDVLSYLALSIPCTVAGFLAGVIVGSRVDLWSRTMTMPLSERPTETPSTNPGDGSARPWYRKGQTWIGVAVAAIGLFTAVQWYSSGQETRRIAECQAIYANGFADAIEARTKESAAVADGQDALWTLVDRGFTAPSPELRDEFRRQVRLYLDSRAKARAAQAENPYPPPPRDLCK